MNFVIQMRGWKDSVAYIVVYGGKKSCVGEVKFRGDRIRKFLEAQNIESSRIKLIDAGHLQKWQVSLFIASASVEPLTAEFVNKIDSHLPLSEVKMAKRCKDFVR
jgi:hypothetical protein